MHLSFHIYRFTRTLHTFLLQGNAELYVFELLKLCQYALVLPIGTKRNNILNNIQLYFFVSKWSNYIFGLHLTERGREKEKERKRKRGGEREYLLFITETVLTTNRRNKMATAARMAHGCKSPYIEDSVQFSRRKVFEIVYNEISRQISQVRM